jgi:hypothetical protein
MYNAVMFDYLSPDKFLKMSNRSNIFPAHSPSTISTTGHKVCEIKSQVIIHALYHFTGDLFSGCATCHGQHASKFFSNFKVFINAFNKNGKLGGGIFKSVLSSIAAKTVKATVRIERGKQHVANGMSERG